MPTSSSWIAPGTVRQASPRLRLFCFPHAGGGASVFRGWAAALPPAVELCPVQLPGRENRSVEAAHEDIEALVARVADGLSESLDVPFAFFGYSMGALVAFELARELRRRGARQPAHLFLAAHRGPREPQREPPIHHLPAAEFLGDLVRKNGIPAEVVDNADVIEFFLPLLRADITLCERYAYRAEPPLDCAFSLYGGTRDPDVTRAGLEAWALDSAAACTVRLLDGDHFFLHQRRAELLGMLAHDATRLLATPLFATRL